MGGEEEIWLSECPMCLGPPPTFHIPPPPCPPDLEPPGPTCPSGVSTHEVKNASQMRNFHLALLMAIAAALVLVSVAIMVIVYGIRMWKHRGKSRLGLSQEQIPSHGPNSMDLYTPEKTLLPHLDGFSVVPIAPETKKVILHLDHTYNSMSSASGSDNCTGSTSDGGPHDLHRFVPHHSPHMCSLSPVQTDSEDDSLAPFLGGPTEVEEKSPRTRQRLTSTLAPLSLGNHHYENIPMTPSIRGGSQPRRDHLGHHRMVLDQKRGGEVPPSAWKYSRCHIAA